LGNITEAIEAYRRNDWRGAARLLEEELKNPQLKHENRIEVCEWIGQCYEGLEEYEDAGIWYEWAAKYTLEDQTKTTSARIASAVKEIDRAMECYKAEGDLNLIKHASAIKYRLQHNKCII
jgi:tetratricopeptide (TPR) repeat protein